MKYNKILQILLLFFIISTIYASKCTTQNYSIGHWQEKSNDTLKFTLYPQIGRTSCRSHGDLRMHELYEWEPSDNNCPMINMSDTNNLNSCFMNKTVTFIGDSHYHYTGEAMEYYCKVNKCSFIVEAVRDNFIVDTKTFLVNSRFIHAVNTSQVLIIGIGHHYTETHTFFSNLNYTWEMVQVTAEKAVHSILNYLKSNFHGDAIVWMSYTPRHFEGGDWNSNGSCTSNSTSVLSQIITTGEAKYINFWNYMNNVILTHKKRSKKLFISDLTNISLFRSGSHPSIYTGKTLKNMDCSHYCIPGVPDEWNRLIMTMLCSPNSSYYGLLNNKTLSEMQFNYQKIFLI